MSRIVFFRGANVGGNNVFKPAELAKSLASIGCINVGAARTFVILNSVSESRLRAMVAQKCKVSCALMICSGDDLRTLVARAKFPQRGADDEQRLLSILAAVPSKSVELPIHAPETKNWQLKIFALIGRFVLSVRRPTGDRIIYPNIVERAFAVAATTRNWNTIEKIMTILERENV